jgi:hypothetical protein
MYKIEVFNNHDDIAREDKEYYKSLSPEQRLDIVEELRLSAGKFLYEYPTRFRRVVVVTSPQ